MKATELLEELKEYTNSETIHMYIIERKKKAGSKTKTKPSEKFEYIPLQVDLSPELAPIIQKKLKNVIEKKIKNDIEIKDYQVIDDTEEKIQTYNDLGKITGFKEFLNSRDRKSTRLNSSHVRISYAVFCLKKKKKKKKKEK